MRIDSAGGVAHRPDRLYVGLPTGSDPAPTHRERIVADPVRSLAIVVEGRQSELVRVYHGMERRLEGRPGVRITAWVDGEPGSLSIAPRRPR